MKKFNPPQKLLLFIYAVAVLLFCHHFIFRPLVLDWGAPKHIRNLALSGDTFTQVKGHTRAILIEATPEEIWPWLMQVGQDRGGFYSYQWLENLARADMRNVYTLKPELQAPRYAGDTVWLANKNHYNGQGYQILAEIITGESFVMVGGEDYARIKRGENAMGSWSFYLYPANDDKTWLIARSSSGDLTMGNKVLRYFFYEMPHFIMERKMLRTMKKLAEQESKDNALSGSK